MNLISYLISKKFNNEKYNLDEKEFNGKLKQFLSDEIFRLKEKI